MNERESWPTAVAYASKGAQAWRAAADEQRSAEPDHGDFYALAGELVDTLRTLEHFAGVLRGQVAGYADGRPVYDDEGGDPRARLRSAGLHLAVVSHGVAEAERAANEFWSAIGHIGVRVQP